MSQDAKNHTSMNLLTKLRLFEKKSDAAPKLNKKNINLFSQRQLPFDWVHMGTMDLTFGELFDVIQSTPELSIPRTGHLGNWEDIVRGRAGTLDYNHIICGTKALGYPLLYDFNQTEDESLQNGDWVYMPGSLISKGRRTELRLFTWDGSQFVERDRKSALFTPFVLTPINDQLVPITQVHRQNIQKWTQYDFKFQSDLILANRPFLEQLFHVLIENARSQPDAEQNLQLISDRVVELNGRVYRSDIQLDGEGYRVGETKYKDTGSLLEALLLPIIAAKEGEEFMNQVSRFPKHLPLISKYIQEILFIILNSHYPNAQVCRESMTQPCNPHLHWGAVGMAGYPPLRKGHFAKSHSQVKKLLKVIIDNFPQVDPVFFVLLPAAPFALFPSSACPQDKEPIEELIDMIQRATESGIKVASMNELIAQTVETWLLKVENHISDYFINRFSKRRSVYSPDYPSNPEFNEMVEPRNFSSLTLRQASMIIGGLTKLLNNE